MERFAAGLRNPIVRQELTAALDLGKGVFRAFKDILGSYPEAEKLWFSYKDREMKREILRWYNGLREEWGLERIGEEPEDTDDLVLEDFRFRPPQADDDAFAAELHKLCTEEAAENGNPVCSSTDVRLFPGDAAIIAETVGSDFAGYITAVQKDKALHISLLEVKPEYRGLGVGETLITRLLESVDKNKIDQISIDIPAKSEGFSRVLLRNSFEIFSARYCVNIKNM
jgi:ribosomal protein S18 acetylase RimI-like enzyme